MRIQRDERAERVQVRLSSSASRLEGILAGAQSAQAQFGARPLCEC